MAKFKPFKTKSICFTHSSASFGDDAQNCHERGKRNECECAISSTYIN